jgi:hypothetical protein
MGKLKGSLVISRRMWQNSAFSKRYVTRRFRVMNKKKPDNIKPEDTRGLLSKLLSYPAPTQGNIVISAGIVSVLLSAIIGVGFLTPILIALPLLPFFFGAMKDKKYDVAMRHSVRWLITVFLCIAVLSVYVPHRAQTSIPFAHEAVEHFTGWISGSAARAPFGPLEILLGILAVVVSSLLTGGLVTVLGGSIGLCTATYLLAYIVRHGDNIVHVGLIGLPPWILSFVLSGIFLLVPASSFFYDKIKRDGKKGKAQSQALRKYALWGAAFFLLSLVSYFALHGIWNSLIKSCTIL